MCTVTSNFRHSGHHFVAHAANMGDMCAVCHQNDPAVPVLSGQYSSFV